MADETKGRGWHGNSQGHRAAGKAGGQKTSETHGRDFYKKIGKKGGQSSPGNFKNNPQRAREAGRKGGKARAKARSSM